MKSWKSYPFYCFLILCLFSCKKDDKLDIPMLPPVSSMAVDLSFVTSEKSGSVSITNWQFTNVSLAFWNAFIYGDCSLALTAFEKAIGEKSSQIDKNQWQWFSKFNFDTLAVKARLLGKQLQDSIEWKLMISTGKLLDYEPEFLWIEGMSASDQSGGWWLIYENTSNPGPLLKINWSQNETASNKFLIVKPDDPYTGQYLEYGRKNNQVFDSFYTLKLHNNNFIYIEIDKASKVGHIKSTLLFNNNLWHCWNSSFENISCN
jgi:hypothetical protein